MNVGQHNITASSSSGAEGDGVVHPGEILLKEYLQPRGISQYRLAKAIGVPQARISKVVRGQRGISTDTAIRLGLYLRTPAALWINLQSRYDFLITQSKIGGQLEEEIKPFDDSKRSIRDRNNDGSITGSAA